MASRKKTNGSKAPEKKISESLESANGLAQSLADSAFEVAETVVGKVDEAADKLFTTVEDIAGEHAKPARKVYRTLSKVRDNGLSTAKEQTQKWLKFVADLTSAR